MLYHTSLEGNKAMRDHHPALPIILSLFLILVIAGVFLIFRNFSKTDSIEKVTKAENTSPTSVKVSVASLASSVDFDPTVFTQFTFLLSDPKYKGVGIGPYHIKDSDIALYIQDNKFDFSTFEGNALASLLILNHLKVLYKCDDTTACLIYIYGPSRVFSPTPTDEIIKTKTILGAK